MPRVKEARARGVMRAELARCYCCSDVALFCYCYVAATCRRDSHYVEFTHY